MEELDLTNSPAGIQEDIVCRICLVNSPPSPLACLTACRHFLTLSQANKFEVPHLKLIRPCLCSGTQAHVHVQCLDHWRSVSAAAGQHSCSTCGHSYRKRSSVMEWFWQGIVDGSMCMSLCAVAYGVAVAVVGGLLWAADVTNMPFLGLPFLTQLDDARLYYSPSSAQGLVIACAHHLLIANLLVSLLISFTAFARDAFSHITDATGMGCSTTPHCSSWLSSELWRRCRCTSARPISDC